MALRDDLMVVIPDRLFGGIMDKGTFYDGYKLSTRSDAPCSECRGRGWCVGECRPQEVCGVCDGTGNAPRNEPKQERPFDPLIKVPAGIVVDLMITSEVRLSALCSLGPDAGTKHGQAWLKKAVALADDIEIVIPEEVSEEGWIYWPIRTLKALRWAADHQAESSRAKHPKTTAFLKHFAAAPSAEKPGILVTETWRTVIEDKPANNSTRLERVAAGLEEPIETAHIKERCGKHAIFPIYDDIGIASPSSQIRRTAMTCAPTRRAIDTSG